MMASSASAKGRRYSEPVRPSRGGQGGEASSVLDGEMTVVLRSGWLTKQGHRFFKSWRRRWFVLTPSHLVYTLRPSSIRSRGRIDLNAVTSVAPVPLRGVQGMAIFTLPGQKDFMIIGDDLPNWMSEIRSACRALAAGAPLTHVNPMMGARLAAGAAQAAASREEFVQDSGRASPGTGPSASEASTGDRDDRDAPDARANHEAAREVDRLASADRPMLVGVALSALERALMEDDALSPPDLSALRSRLVLAVRALRERHPALWTDAHGTHLRRLLEVITHKQRARRPVISPSARPMRRRSALAGPIPGTTGSGALESAVPALMGRPTLPVSATASDRGLARGGDGAGGLPRAAASSPSGPGPIAFARRSSGGALPRQRSSLAPPSLPAAAAGSSPRRGSTSGAGPSRGSPALRALRASVGSPAPRMQPLPPSAHQPSAPPGLGASGRKVSSSSSSAASASHARPPADAAGTASWDASPSMAGRSPRFGSLLGQPVAPAAQSGGETAVAAAAPSRAAHTTGPPQTADAAPGAERAGRADSSDTQTLTSGVEVAAPGSAKPSHGAAPQLSIAKPGSAAASGASAAEGSSSSSGGGIVEVSGGASTALGARGQQGRPAPIRGPPGTPAAGAGSTTSLSTTTPGTAQGSSTRRSTPSPFRPPPIRTPTSAGKRSLGLSAPGGSGTFAKSAGDVLAGQRGILRPPRQAPAGASDRHVGGSASSRDGPAADGAGGGGPAAAAAAASSARGGTSVLSIASSGPGGRGPASVSSASTAPQATFHDLFELQGELGRGAFSVVHKTRHRRSGREFAVKVLDREAMTDDDVQSLVGEVSTQRYLRHPNVVRLVAFFDSDPECFFLVTELCTGGELFDRIVRQTRFSEREAAGYVYVLLDAIGYFHKHGIVHRDLKPENILFQDARPGAPLKIADFGFAVHSGTGETLRSLAGSPNYLAPEIVNNRPYGVAVDMWSLGVITYILLCGYMPFDSSSQPELFRLISAGRFTFPDKDWGSVSREAKDFVSRLLVVDPRDRLTAEAALAHRWITTTDLSEAHLSRSVGKLRSFHSKRRASMLRNAVRAVHFGRRASSAAAMDSPRRAVALRSMGITRSAAAGAMLRGMEAVPPSPVASMAVNADPADDETRFNGMLDSPRVVADGMEPDAGPWDPRAASGPRPRDAARAAAPPRGGRRPRSLTASFAESAFLADVDETGSSTPGSVAAPGPRGAAGVSFLPRPPPGSPPVV